MAQNFTNGERLMRLETQIDDIKKDIEIHNNEQREDFDKIFKKLDSLSQTFAAKWVEKVAIGALSGIVVGIVLAVIYLIR